MKSASRGPDLSIVVPAFEEEKRIGKSLDQLSKFLTNDSFFKDKNVEIIVVSADSSDSTHEVIAKRENLFDNLVFIKPGKKLGKGRDVQRGMLEARGEAVIFMDADLATPLSHLEEFYRAYQEGNDVIIATRSLGQYRGTLVRTLSSIMGNLIFRITSGMWIEDSQCGFKLFSSHATDLCFSKMKIMGWGFDMEILSIAKSNHLKIKSIRVDDWQHILGGPFEQRILKNSFQSLGELITVFGRNVFGKYRDTSTSKTLEEES